MEALLLSTGLVALAEVGDKTQLLSFILAARYRRPVPIVLGILIATLANHGLAAYVGHFVASLLSPEALRWILGLQLLRIYRRIGHRHGAFHQTLTVCIINIVMQS